MRLREAILQLMIAEGSKRFDEQGVHDTFLLTLRTGIKDDTIKSQIEPLIRRGVDIDDRKLIDEINQITEEEEARRKKREKEARRMMNENKDSNTKDRKSLQVAETNVSNTVANEFLDAVKLLQQSNTELRDEVSSLRKEVNSLKNSGNQNKKFGCNHCKQNNKGDSCRHCFKCGAGDHKIADCPKNS